jgi:hypothetical protein
MLKPKVILNLELDETKLPKGWEKDIENFFLGLNDSLICFGTEVRKIIKIKKVEVKK